MVLVNKQQSKQEEVVTRIKATRGWGSLRLGELWEYRDLIYFLLWREIKGRYKQMALGPLWIVLTPLVGIVMNTLIFGTLAKLPSDGLPYPLFNFSAMLPWAFFTGALSRTSGSLASNQALISKVYFPRLVVAVVAALSGLLDFMVSFVMLILLIIYYHFFPVSDPKILAIPLPDLKILVIPLLVVLATITSLAIGLCLAALQAWFRDVGFMLGYMMQAWMYLTPVVYSSSVIPEQWRFIYQLNPMTTVVDGFRWALLGSGELSPLPASISIASMVILLWAGAHLFKRTERTIVDIV